LTVLVIPPPDMFPFGLSPDVHVRTTQQLNRRVLLPIPSVLILVRLCFVIPLGSLPDALRCNLRIDLQSFLEDSGCQSC
jgi:hypothetical protein